MQLETVIRRPHVRCDALTCQCGSHMVAVMPVAQDGSTQIVMNQTGEEAGRKERAVVRGQQQEGCYDRRRSQHGELGIGDLQTWDTCDVCDRGDRGDMSGKDEMDEMGEMSDVGLRELGVGDDRPMQPAHCTHAPNTSQVHTTKWACG